MALQVSLNALCKARSACGAGAAGVGGGGAVHSGLNYHISQ